MTMLETKRSTPRLSEVARHVRIPDGIVATAWPRVVALLAGLGVTFDEWEAGIGQLALGKRADGKYAATVGGIVLSIPRQTGKTFVVGMIVVALCILFPGLTVVWTAHRARTSTKTFSTLKAVTSRPAFAVHMLEPRSSNGEQELRFVNGSVIMFGAREQGFGRGFDEIDVEVFDEAQILTERALEDMIPATNQSRQPAGALLFFMGTPPRPIDPGEEFTARRTRALSGVGIGAKDMVFVEFSADQDADTDDQEQWRKANPSFPARTPLESMLRMRANLTDEESFRREALGIWSEVTSASIIPLKKWHSSGIEPCELRTPVVAVDFRTGIEQSYAIVVAGLAEDEHEVEKPAVDVALYEQGFGKNWTGDHIVHEVFDVCTGLGLDTVVVDVYGDGNALLIPKLEALGLTVQRLNTIDMRNASVSFRDGVVNRRILHIVGETSPPLDVAVAGAAKRRSGEGFTWSQEKASVDLVPLRAASAALWVLHSSADADYDVLESIF